METSEEREGSGDEMVDRHLPWFPPRVPQTRERLVRVHLDDQRLPSSRFVLCQLSAKGHDLNGHACHVGHSANNENQLKIVPP